MHSDHAAYLKFSGRYRLEKSVNSLLGIVQGIAVDAQINSREIAFLQTWLEEHREIERTHPFNELMPVVSRAISDGVLTNEEKEDILWLCERLCSAEFIDLTAADMQRLHAMLGGIAADGVITESEARGLSDWLAEHEHLKTLWPYDEVDSCITAALRDKQIDETEHKALLGFFREFTAVLDDRAIKSPSMVEGQKLVGVCAVCPEIIFAGSTFCFTGASYKYTRAVFGDVVKKHGGTVCSSVSPKLNYLIIGAEGNPCWMYACYGRKVEKAVTLRKQGVRLSIVHENDFHDVVEDLRTP